MLREAVMKTFYEFRSEADPDLHGFTDEVSGSKLPSENGPWTFIRQQLAGATATYLNCL